MEGVSLQDLADMLYLIGLVLGSMVLFGLGFIGGNMR